MLLSFMPLMIYSVHITQSYILNTIESLIRILITTIAIATSIIYALNRLYNHYTLAKKYRLGYEGEVAVGQKLTELISKGYFVFHDLIADQFNIDHILVGPAGVYAIETKARRKSDKTKVPDHHKVEYNGSELRFPDWVETKPINQAMIQAKWLASWLTSATGESVAVKPVIVLPGWYVKLTGKSNVLVINEKTFEAMLKTPATLTLEQIKRIKHQLDQRCRKDRVVD